MDELEPLATALRRELGEPPEAWQRAQRARLGATLRESFRVHSARRKLLPRLAAAVAILALVLWFAGRHARSDAIDRWLVAEELSEPFRFADGSSIALDAGARGRLFADATAVRFDLHAGNALFDVTPGQGRPWRITAGKNEVRVIGTRFTVSYGPAETFEVGVDRGIVSVHVPDRNASVELAAGDRLRGRPGQMEVVHNGAPLASTSAFAAEPKLEPSALAPAAQLARSESTPPSAQPPNPPNGTRHGADNAEVDWQARYRAGNYAESLALLRSSGLVEHLQDLPPATLATVADAARLGGDPELAVRALKLLLRRFPHAAEARHGMFLLGRVHVLQGDRAAAITAFESYLETQDSAAYANEALGRLIELYLARGDREQAQSVARRYLARAPQGPYYRLARSLVAQPQ